MKISNNVVSRNFVKFVVLGHFCSDAMGICPNLVSIMLLTASFDLREQHITKYLFITSLINKGWRYSNTRLLHNDARKVCFYHLADF